MNMSFSQIKYKINLASIQNKNAAKIKCPTAMPKSDHGTIKLNRNSLKFVAYKNYVSITVVKV